LEALTTVDTVVLDKTGTLTFGTPQVQEVVPANGFSERQIIEAAGIAEFKSEHPLAKAVLARATKLAILLAAPDEFSYTPGRGIRVRYRGEEIAVGSRAFIGEAMTSPTQPGNGSDGASEIWVTRGGQLLGEVKIADILRPEAKDAVTAMRRMGLKTVLLSGDSQTVTASVGRNLGVDEAVGDLMPAQKAEWVSRMRAKNRKVAMVGDGINDAPALVEANVGIAMGSGTDVAQESADVILIGGDLSKLVETLRIARHCRRIIYQNFVGTLVVDSIGVGMAAFGFLNPLLAAFIHVASEMVFILNSARLLPRRIAV